MLKIGTFGSPNFFRFNFFNFATRTCFVLRASEFLSVYLADGYIQTLAAGIGTPKNKNVFIKGLHGSLDSVIIGSCFHLYPSPTVVVVQDRDGAGYLQNDLQGLLGCEVLLYPMSYRRPYEFEEIDNANVLLRTEVLSKISAGNRPVLILTYPEALSEKVITRKVLKSNTFSIRKGESFDLSFLEEFLAGHGFEKAEFVYEAGQFSVRGGIIDVFSFTNELPFRIELFGDEVESIRTFDPSSQLSIASLDEMNITPNLQASISVGDRQSFLEFLPPSTHIWFKDFKYTSDVIQQSFDKAKDRYTAIARESGNNPVVLAPEALFETGSRFAEKSVEFKRIEFGNRAYLPYDANFEFKSSSQPSFNKNFNLLVEDLRKNQLNDYKLYIASDLPRQFERLLEIFEQIDPGLKFTALDFALRQGFIDHQLKILCYTDHQIFERFLRYRGPERFSKSKALTLRELQGLVPGDFVVHIDYGIGKFAGLDKKETNGKTQELIRLIYRDDDLLYVSIHALHKISKYTGKEGSPPAISKLGSPEWDSRKAKVKNHVKEIAKELIALYAKRKASPGFAFSTDSYLQAELESSFIYDDTPDQVTATEAVKKDMEQTHPMDRLICGDVGFGKTEVAIRAAFKAVQDGKQVAVLVPTTLLAMQHHRTFSERLKDFPVRIEYLSRFKSAKDSRTILTDLKDGKIEIIIGTHRLIGKSVEFKELGLLIVDEEQKFGVKVKDRLKELKVNVDVLTLSATPIPRTLHFSLMGARDLSIIATPPPNRQPVTTLSNEFDLAVIRDAISFELRRGGQVFFVHNRIHDIDEIANSIHTLVPDARIGVAHGQMEGARLEKVMIRFIEGEYDVLVSTNIVESGLDIPNANTIIINRAHLFGLSDLHQMRGRVGRSNKKAFCYLLTPPPALLSADARKRLVAFEEFSDLGDGFKVAMRDLDIRGAGNLLGAEQSGFINDLGFDTYHKILDDAVSELKETEFKDLFASDLMHRVPLVMQECVIETDLELLIPETYVADTSERLQLYSRLDSIRSEEELNIFIEELTDRFGPSPDPIPELINSVRLRWLGEKLGFEKLVLKSGRMKGQFVSKQEYFNSEPFGKVISYVQEHARRCRLKDTSNKPSITVEDIETIDQGLKVLNEVYANTSAIDMLSR